MGFRGKRSPSGLLICGVEALSRQRSWDLAFIERRGWTLVDTYVDHGVSGSREKRPELDRMVLKNG